MQDVIKPPTLSEFIGTVREAFAFLGRFGFDEVGAPSHRGGDPFQLWFRADKRFVVIAGEGHGTVASVTLEHEGLELNEIYLVPSPHRPRQTGKKHQPGQLQQVREAARRLEHYGADFLRGDIGRFLALAKPLPPYKRPVA
jgi:hypothetical protein